MNEPLQSKLVEILSGIQSAVKVAGDFAVSQLPDLAQSYILYGRVVSIAAFLCALAVLLIALWVVFHHTVRSKKVDKFGNWADSRTASTILGCVACVPSFFFMLSWGRDILLVWFAPKIWLLQKLGEMIK